MCVLPRLCSDIGGNASAVVICAATSGADVFRNGRCSSQRGKRVGGRRSGKYVWRERRWTSLSKRLTRPQSRADMGVIFPSYSRLAPSAALHFLLAKKNKFGGTLKCTCCRRYIVGCWDLHILCIGICHLSAKVKHSRPCSYAFIFIYLITKVPQYRYEYTITTVVA